ncbi:multicopper oxidase domain-containing protein [Paenibacillus thermotolerans]|uniref:multicopper oxidase domain-containing protein n=1 Tax=Paenibacillus thermotolerans TaxID=3027807 RepID=UPI002367C654|nr:MULTISPECIES: multicopper oxidase domain-containing protein [unclassified Paenibacillus]
MKNYRFKWPILLFAALLVFVPCSQRSADAAIPAVKKYQLYATDGYLTLPDGKQVYVWGYSLKNEPGSALYPSPTLEVNEGDQVEITLTNIGPLKKGIKKLAHTIHWHGLDTNQQNDGVPHTSLAIQVGESFTYKFTAGHAGTYFYHCHVDTIEHLQMGMFGAFIVKAKDGVNQAWTGGPAYDKDYVFVVNEIDPVWHRAVEEGKAYDRTSFNPKYWTINGKSYPDTEETSSTMIEGKVGQTVLIRIINSGYQPHSFHMHGFHFDVVASDGRPLPQATRKDTILIGPGERYDLLVTFDQDGMFPLHSHNIVDNTNNGVYPGGLHTMMNVRANSEAMETKTIVLRKGQNTATVDGKEVKMPQPVLNLLGYNYVPLRFIADQMNAELKWNDKEQSVTYKAGETSIQFWINKQQALVNDRVINITAVPKQINGYFMLPVRFLSEQLHARIETDNATGNIILTVPTNVPQPALESVKNGHDHHGSDTDSGSSSQSGDIPSEPLGSIDPLTVEIRKGEFVPNKLTVKKGQTVTWVNKDTDIHTVYDLTDVFQSKNLLSNDIFTFQFMTEGSYTYYCSTHPIMQGEIVVTE